MIGKLGERLGRANANATGYPYPLEDARAYRVGAGHQVPCHAVQSDEGFVDAIDLLRGAEACRQAHHAIAHVTVEGVVGRQGDQARGFLQMPDGEPGRSHRDSEVFGFVASRHGAAVVVAQDDDRPSYQAWPESSLARDIKVVAIDQGEHTCARRGCLTAGIV